MAGFDRHLDTLELELYSEISEVSVEQNRFKDLKISHLIGAVLALFGLIVFVGLVSGNQAIAEDPAQFQQEQIDTDVEEDIRKTRWLLEQPDERQRIRR